MIDEALDPLTDLFMVHFDVSIHDTIEASTEASF